MDETTTDDSSSFFSDFLSSAADGLGIGDGSSAASTLGDLLRPTVQQAVAPSASAPVVKAPAKTSALGSTSTKTIVLVAAIAVGAYLIARK